VLLMKKPSEMIDPSKAFKNNPKLPCSVELSYRGVSPMYGGDAVNGDGSPRDDNLKSGL